MHASVADWWEFCLDGVDFSLGSFANLGYHLTCVRIGHPWQRTFLEYHQTTCVKLKTILSMFPKRKLLSTRIKYGP